MNDFIRAVRITIGVICMALMSMAVIGNLFLTAWPEDEIAAQQTLTVREQQGAEDPAEKAAEAALFPEENAAEESAAETEKILENQIAALRMERDSSWQRLKEGLHSLQFEEKQQLLRQYELLQYKEQRLELLLEAKGICHCLVVLEEQQANVIVAQEELASQYEKIYDLVQRNTTYDSNQIILIPLQTAEEML